MWNEGWAPASHLAMARAKEAGLQMEAVAHAWAIGIVCGKAPDVCSFFRQCQDGSTVQAASMET